MALQTTMTRRSGADGGVALSNSAILLTTIFTYKQTSTNVKCIIVMELKESFFTGRVCGVAGLLLGSKNANA